jgi:hypothetical protein
MSIHSNEVGTFALLCASLLGGCSSDAILPCFGLKQGKTYAVSVRELLPPEGVARPSCGDQFDFGIGDELTFLVTEQIAEESEGQSCFENIASWENPMLVELGTLMYRHNVSSGWSVFSSYSTLTKGECEGDWTAEVVSISEDGDPFVPYAAGNPVLSLHRQFIAHDANSCPGITFDSHKDCFDRFGVEMSAE